MIQLMPNSTLKDLVFDTLAKHIGTSVARLEDTARTMQKTETRRSAPTNTASSTRHSAIRKAILYLLHHPELAGEHELDPAWAQSSAPGFVLLTELVNTLRTHPMPLGILLEHYRDSPQLKTLDALACLPAPQDSDDAQVRQSMWRDMLGHLAAAYARERLRELTAQPFDQLQTHERQELLRLSSIKATS